ncbi:ThiF family adenylyltransferase [Leptolyngbya sp. NIES-2104]|uniref:ThiF family adenylyltransferase n=1 Tax=Leptolyngbya sp. NIES-2104 TaxID=1552121 RepID=UPI0006EC45BA|nr:ThiF family adenylyltransferase [Leptolyngbya sp. NIES-2104]GAP99731.1 ThiF family protein, ubiquitin-activating enzyme [Leptolyngbya sp. NIES-2104]
MQTVNTDYLDAKPIWLGEFDQVLFVLVGCGGNGSYMAETIARFCRLLIQQGKRAQALFFDPQTVEVKNIPRQRFSDAEIGLNKAQSLAARYSLLWGVDICAYPKVFQPDLLHSHYNWLTLIIGCVDDGPARNAIAQSLEQNSPAQLPKRWWLDLGNHRESGQVLLGSAPTSKHFSWAFQTPSHCLTLPSPALVHPEILLPRPDQLVNAPMSCAEIAMLNAQSQTVNGMCAAIASDYLNRLLFGQLKKWATYFDLEAGTTQTRYTSPQAIAKFAEP